MLWYVHFKNSRITEVIIEIIIHEIKREIKINKVTQIKQYKNLMNLLMCGCFDFRTIYKLKE